MQASKITSIRLIKHEAVPDCGSFEVRYGDGRPSRCFYWDELPSRRLRPEALKRDVALETAPTVARTARDELERQPPKAGVRQHQP
ncbi:hypothetical protein [Bradyrhizobium sp. CCBAU 51745]|uniref:hypothetical protein n=1 Tax=Bradyrhizobium sp. CCBAU 51745 TaxID=1325099 RepID=UPI002306A98E|nr:hypothetical protein [Bradyrhizobium sp. CCBAU 51745]